MLEKVLQWFFGKMDKPKPNHPPVRKPDPVTKPDPTPPEPTLELVPDLENEPSKDEAWRAWNTK